MLAAAISSNAQSQSGQIMVLGLILAGAALVVYLQYFGVGQVVAAKARQTHGLDAAVYSGALVQARAMNMLALVNRAHVGHQVAMAHLVTLGSWAQFGATQAGQHARGNPPAHLITMLFGAQHGAAYAAAARAAGLSAAHGPGENLAMAYQAHSDITLGVLRSAQHAVVASLPDARTETIQSVLRAHYDLQDEAVLDVRITDDTWPGLVGLLPPQQGLRPLVLEAAHEFGFLDDRNALRRNPWVVDARCPHLRHELRRRGATRLDESGQWQSADTLSFHALRSNRWIGCYFREYPMGWGWVTTSPSQTMDGPHVDNAPDSFSSQDFWRWVRSSTDWNIATGDANALANSRATSGRQGWRGGGLPAFYDVLPGSRAKTIAFRVAFRHPGPSKVNVLTESAAETYFARPEHRSDGAHEYPNLFHPYWQARLLPARASFWGEQP